ncbi:ABC transporter substrate-binding protein [Corynebacterium callunae]|uniref:ABC transporter substrate-binding protein n=1 Tax=Corynebacterium callunae TaxID=1721 RepID=UPI0039824A4F
MKITRSRLLAPATVVLSAALLSACGSSDSLEGSPSESAAAGDSAIVIGSQDYYSNEIIAEIYAQALEAGGYDVERDFRIGQREVYVSEIENGSIDLFPEYSGPLLQYWEPNTEARLSEDVYTALTEAAPENLEILEQSEATDQDAYVVTRAFADQYGLKTIEDLAKVDVPLTLGGNSEGENRPNGPKGLASAYGIEVGFTPIEDSGGPLTVKALTDNEIQLAIIYTADPTISDNDLVVLEDTKGLFLASHVVPVASADMDPGAQDIINKISTEMSPEELIALNAQSVNDQANAADIAAGWLEENPV